MDHSSLATVEDAEPLGLSLLVRRARVPEDLARSHAVKNFVAIAQDATRLLARSADADAAARIARLDAALSRIVELSDTTPRRPRLAPQREVRVEEIVHSVCWTLRDRAEAAKVTIFVAASRGIVRGDGDALYAALFNLVTNAIEATDIGGAVFVDASATHEGDHLWTVRDTGRGIPTDTLAAFSDPRPWTQDGLGLGVAIAVNIIHNHGGILRFDTRRGSSSPLVGSGTCVTIWLPSLETRVEMDGEISLDVDEDDDFEFDENERKTRVSHDVGPI